MASQGRTQRQEDKIIRREDYEARIEMLNILIDLVENKQEMKSLQANMTGGEDGDQGLVMARCNILQMVQGQNFKLLNKLLPDKQAVDVKVSGKIVEINMTGCDDDENDEYA